MGFYLVVNETLVGYFYRRWLLVMESVLSTLPLLIHVWWLPVHAFLRPSFLSNYRVSLHCAPRYSHHFDALPIGVPCLFPRIDSPFPYLILSC